MVGPGSSSAQSRSCGYFPASVPTGTAALPATSAQPGSPRGGYTWRTLTSEKSEKSLILSSKEQPWIEQSWIGVQLTFHPNRVTLGSHPKPGRGSHPKSYFQGFFLETPNQDSAFSILSIASRHQGSIIFHSRNKRERRLHFELSAIFLSCSLLYGNLNS